MKKLFILLLVLVVGYVAWKYASGDWIKELCEGDSCVSDEVVVDEAFQEEVEARNESYPQILFMIDDFNAYEMSEGTYDRTCGDEEVSFESYGHLELFEAGDYSLSVTATPNPDDLSTEEFKEMYGDCCDGAGCAGPLKAYETHLVWGYPNCSSGWAPDEDDERYDDFMECVEFSEWLDEYLEL